MIDYNLRIQTKNYALSFDGKRFWIFYGNIGKPVTSGEL